MQNLLRPEIFHRIQNLGCKVLHFQLFESAPRLQHLLEGAAPVRLHQDVNIFIVFKVPHKFDAVFVLDELDHIELLL